MNILIRTAVPNFLAPGTGFVEDNYSTDQGWGNGFGFTCLPSVYLQLCGLVPNRPWTSTGLQPRGWDPLIRGCRDPCGQLHTSFQYNEELSQSIESAVFRIYPTHGNASSYRNANTFMGLAVKHSGMSLRTYLYIPVYVLPILEAAGKKITLKNTVPSPQFNLPYYQNKINRVAAFKYYTVFKVLIDRPLYDVLCNLFRY